MRVGSIRHIQHAAPYVTIGVLFLLSGGHGWAETSEGEDSGQVSFFFESFVQKGLGGIAYDLSADVGSYDVLSRLEFPQFSLEAGARMGLSIGRGDYREWLIEAGIAHSTFDISGTMNDYDWIKVPGIPKIPFSYTESKSSTVNWHASLEIAWTFARQGPWLFASYVSYRYQNFSQVEDTVKGWQYILDNNLNPTDLVGGYDPTTDVLEYSLISHALGLGFLMNVQAFDALNLELRAAYTPVHVEDRDDHILRTKLSTASGWGNGLYADFRAVYQLPPVSRGVASYCALEGEFIYYVVDTSQRQYWYGHGDEPDVPMGTLYTGIGHVITSTQFQVGLSIGFRF